MGDSLLCILGWLVFVACYWLPIVVMISLDCLLGVDYDGFVVCATIRVCSVYLLGLVCCFV